MFHYFYVPNYPLGVFGPWREIPVEEDNNPRTHRHDPAT